jgi:hypothetical protein
MRRAWSFTLQQLLTAALSVHACITHDQIMFAANVPR